MAISYFIIAISKFIDLIILWNALQRFLFERILDVLFDFNLEFLRKNPSSNEKKV